VIIQGSTTIFQQISEIRRKLGLVPVPVGGAAGEVLTKLSGADYDFDWVAILGGIILPGRGIVFSGGNTVNFAQAAAYTPGAIPFATGAATMGFDAANLFWDDTNNYLGVGIVAPAADVHVFRAYNDALAHQTLYANLTTSTVGGAKRAFLSILEGTTGAALVNVGLNSGGVMQCLFSGSGNATGFIRYTGLEVYHGKSAAGTGNMDYSVGLYVQGVNLNAVGTIGETRDIFIPTPATTGPITLNYPIFQQNPTGINFIAGFVNLNLMTLGSVLFTGASGRITQDNANLFWDDTNNRLGIGNTAPGARLEVRGATGDTLRLSNAAGLWYQMGRNTVTGFLDFKGTQAGFTGYDFISDDGTHLLTIIDNGSVQGIIATALNYWAGFSAFGSTASVNTTFALFGASTAAIASQRILRGSADYAGTVEGDLWNDFTRHCLTAYIAGVKQFDKRTMFVQTADQVIANTNVETTLFGAGIGTLTMPANFLTVGKTVKIEIHGHFENTAPAPTLQIRFYAGATLLMDTGAVVTPIFTGSEHFFITAWITCQSTGAGGNSASQLFVLSHVGASGAGTIFMPEAVPIVAGLDTTIAKALNVTAQWGTADAANIIDCHLATVEICA
jgi:hypothetical protein